MVFEVAGGKDTFQTAWRIARPNAVVVIVAMYEDPQILPLPDMYGKNLVFKTGGVDGASVRRLWILLRPENWTQIFLLLTAVVWIRLWRLMIFLSIKRIML